MKRKGSRTYPPVAERLWAKVVKTDSCWLWTGGCGGFGHGHIRDGAKKYQTHRLSWELSNGPIPDGFYVLHRCDNPPCCNPDHLFLGTQQDNVDDCIAKGRYKFRPCGFGSRGEIKRQPSKKLTAEQVQFIRSTPRTDGWSARLAKELGVSQSHVIRLNNRNAKSGWAWLRPLTLSKPQPVEVA